MKQSSVSSLVLAFGLAGMVFLVTQSFTLPVLVLGASVSVVLAHSIDGWWRKAYSFMVLATGAAASHITSIVMIGDIAKVIALGILVLATLVTTRTMRSKWAGGGINS